MRDDSSGLLIDRLAASIVDESLPLKDVEKELRGCVAEVAVKKRGLGKREVANRCGVTEKSIDNYLKEARSNPKSPEREISRLLQDGALSLEEIYEGVRPVLCHGRHFTLDDAKRALEKLVRTGEVEERPGKRYQGSDRPMICNPLTVEAYRDLVDQKARDLDYIILTQKEVTPGALKPKGTQHFARVVKDTNLVRIDFTVDVPEEELGAFYEKLSAEIARLTMKCEKKKGSARVRILLGMRAVALLFGAFFGILLGAPRLEAQGAAEDTIGKAGQRDDSWELDSRSAPSTGGGGDQDPAGPGKDTSVNPAAPPKGDAAQDRRNFPMVIVRGDATYDGSIDISDAVAIIVYLLQGGSLPCAGAADVNGDRDVSLADPVELIRFLFLGSESGSEIGREVNPANVLGHLPCDALMQ